MPMNAPRTQPPFRADHVGSLLRPPGLDSGNLKEKIRQVVAKQEAIGLESVTDGEFSRQWWHLDFLRQLEGVTIAENPGPKFGGTEEQPPIPKVTGKLRYSKPVMVEDFAFLKSVTKKTAKFTIPSPSMLHLRAGRAVATLWPSRASRRARRQGTQLRVWSSTSKARPAILSGSRRTSRS